MIIQVIIKRCRSPPGDVPDKTKQYKSRLRPRAKGKDRKTEAYQTKLRGSRSSLWYIYMSSIRRFYLRSRSGTLLPSLPSPSSFSQPRFPHERYIPPTPPFPFRCHLQRICGAHYSVSLHRTKHEQQRMKQRNNKCIRTQKK